MLVRAGDAQPPHLSAALEQRNSNPEGRRDNLSTGAKTETAEIVGRTLKITMMVLDAGAPGVFATTWSEILDVSGTSLLVVSSGQFTAEQIGDAAEISNQERLKLAGVVVAAPDPDDVTSGRLRPTTPAHQRVAQSAVYA